MNRFGLIGFAIIILANAFALGGVAYNRLAGDSYQLGLSDRELTTPFYYNRHTEDSSVKLRLKWSTKSSHGADWYGQRLIPATREKLETLGFDIPDTNLENEIRLARRQVSKEAYWLLEFNGANYTEVVAQKKSQLEARVKEVTDLSSNIDDSEAFQRLIKESSKRADRAREKYESALNDDTRLFVVDVASSPDKLIAQPKSGQFIVVRGLVSTEFLESQSESGSRSEYRSVKRQKSSNDLNIVEGGWYISLEHLLVDSIQLPLEFAEQFKDKSNRAATSNSRNKNVPVKFEATIAWGKRFEPWVEKFELKKLAD